MFCFLFVYSMLCFCLDCIVHFRLQTKWLWKIKQVWETTQSFHPSCKIPAINTELKLRSRRIYMYLYMTVFERMVCSIGRLKYLLSINDEWTVTWVNGDSCKNMSFYTVSNDLFKKLKWTRDYLCTVLCFTHLKSQFRIVKSNLKSNQSYKGKRILQNYKHNVVQTLIKEKINSIFRNDNILWVRY